MEGVVTKQKNKMQQSKVNNISKKGQTAVS